MKKFLSIFIITSILSTIFIACSKPSTQEKTTLAEKITTVTTETTTENTTTKAESTTMTVTASSTQKQTQAISSTTKKKVKAKTSTSKKKTTKKQTTTKYNYAEKMNITLSKKGKEIIKQVGGMTFNEVMDDVSNFQSFKIADEENIIIDYVDKTNSGLKAQINCSKNGDNSNDIFIKTSKYEFHFYSINNGKPNPNRGIDIKVYNSKDKTYVCYTNAQGKVVIEEAVYKSNAGYKIYNSYIQNGKLVEFIEDYDINNPPICD